MSGVLNWVLEWHKRACPEPDNKAITVQLGCHLEEAVEFLRCVRTDAEGGQLVLDRTIVDLEWLSGKFKKGEYVAHIPNHLRKAALDGLADQIVTAVGVGYRAGMQPVEALTEVDISNWSKFDEKGQPIYDANGKVIKGPNYRPPHLEGYY